MIAVLRPAIELQRLQIQQAFHIGIVVNCGAVFVVPRLIHQAYANWILMQVQQLLL